jgi:hypothetical protein
MRNSKVSHLPFHFLFYKHMGTRETAENRHRTSFKILLRPIRHMVGATAA